MIEPRSILLAICMAGLPLSAKAPVLTYLGRASVKIAGTSTVYIDPFAPGDYSEKADLVLVTHGHDDHNKVSLVALKPGGEIVAPTGAVKGRDYRKVQEGDVFQVGAVSVRVVPAYNANHQREASVGYIVTVDGVSVYHAGDTSFIPEMEALAPLHIDYALFPTDGFWNMGGEEARRCADAVKARFNLAIHSSPKGLYEAERAAKLTGADVLALEPGRVLVLEAPRP